MLRDYEVKLEFCDGGQVHYDLSISCAIEAQYGEMETTLKSLIDTIDQGYAKR